MLPLLLLEKIIDLDIVDIKKDRLDYISSLANERLQKDHIYYLSSREALASFSASKNSSNTLLAAK